MLAIEVAALGSRDYEMMFALVNSQLSIFISLFPLYYILLIFSVISAHTVVPSSGPTRTKEGCKNMTGGDIIKF